MRRSGGPLVAVGVALCLLAGVAFGTLRLTYGQRPADIHVRWADTVTTASRQQLERAYNLTLGEQLEGRTWGYTLTDVSTGNIRRLVEDPAVEDTHEIHRTAFRVGRGAARGPYLSSRPGWIASVLEFVVRASLAGGGLALALGLFKAWRAPRAQDGTATG